MRVIERDVRVPGSPVRWRFQVAQNRELLDEQIGVLRSTLIQSFGVLGLGLIMLAALQAIYGLWPLRKMRRAIAAIRSGPEIADRRTAAGRDRAADRGAERAARA